MNAETERARKAYEQAKARYQKAQTRDRQRERKEDARRKIIIGAAVTSLIANQLPERRANLVAALLKHVAEKDRHLVEPVLNDLLVSETRTATKAAGAQT